MEINLKSKTQIDSSELSFYYKKYSPEVPGDRNTNMDCNNHQVSHSIDSVNNELYFTKDFSSVQKRLQTQVIYSSKV